MAVPYSPEVAKPVVVVDDVSSKEVNVEIQITTEDVYMEIRRLRLALVMSGVAADIGDKDSLIAEN